MNENKFEESLKEVLTGYSNSFTAKTYKDKFDDTDVLMDAFGISQELKRENKQYWGRELGKCWELLLRKLFELKNEEFSPPVRYGADEPADFFCGTDAIDTKYRIGSGDSGTLKKFTTYGELLRSDGYRPVLLFLRTDNLRAAISKCKAGGWTLLMADDTFEYIKDKTGFDLKEWLEKHETEGTFKIDRQ